MGGPSASAIILAEVSWVPGRFVFFDSYDDAMKNSNLPGTQEISGKMMALTDGAPTFYNLDVIEDRSL